MASTPLVDFDTFDLSKVVATRDDLRKVLKQRGRFEMLDGILHFDLDDPIVVGFKDIQDDDWWAADHIPGRPLFPGALMIEAAAQLCSFDYSRRVDTSGKFLGFGGLDKTRFRGSVRPGVRMIFVAEAKRIRSRMFTYSTQGFVDGTLVFETDVMGVVV